MDCQKKVEFSLNETIILQNKISIQSLLTLQEGLVTCVSKTPSGQGFPFNLPDVDYVSKLVLSKSFLNYFLDNINGTIIDNKIYLTVQIIKDVLEFFSHLEYLKMF
jgi:hypothetical protein